MLMVNYLIKVNSFNFQWQLCMKSDVTFLYRRLLQAPFSSLSLREIKRIMFRTVATRSVSFARQLAVSKQTKCIGKLAEIFEPFHIL